MIDKTLLSTNKEYITFWETVSKRDHGGRFDVTNDYLWLKVVDLLNTTCRDLCLRNWDPFAQKYVTIDDDKSHFNGKMGYYNTAGLKPTQLVRDNRRGFVFHTLVFTASGLPLGIEAELVTDANSYDTSSRLITRQLAPSHRSNQVPNLSNHTFFADRLYWSKQFLYNFVLPSGAEIGPSTHKRCHHFPFTMDQTLTRNDTRTLVSKKGLKCLLLKEQRVGSQTLSAVAYRDGHGKVVLGIASGNNQHRSKLWDFHLKSPADRYKLLDEEGDWSLSLSTWIHNIDKNAGLSAIFMEFFHQTCRVEALTTGGSEDQAWFLARAFSFTSSTIDKIIHIVHDILKRETAVGIGIVDSLNVILNYLSMSTIQLPM